MSGAARFVRQHIPGADKQLPRELALSRSWSRYPAPTCTSRPWEDDKSNGHGGSALFPRCSQSRGP